VAELPIQHAFSPHEDQTTYGHSAGLLVRRT
jgi:hypothetical protein